MSRTTDESRRRAIVADDDPLASRVLRQALQEGGFVVVTEAHTVAEAVENTLYYRPEVLLLDMVFPDGDALDVLERLRSAGAGGVVTLVVTSQHDDRAALSALRAGAHGWLRKDTGLGDLPRAVRAALQGEAVVSRRFARVIVEEVRATPEAGIGVRPVQSPLTERQWQVLDMVCAGSSNAEIAARLGVSSDTVRAHIRGIERAVGVEGRERLIAEAARLRAGR